LVRKGEGKAREATIIIRADGSSEHGVVQQVIQICQQVGFERFALRAKQQELVTTRLTDT
ncbi:MAG: biopolymer transporter ExbD, partial [Pirellulales bacterium]|nr:biopolymer transporter ExbD [Pirellulales bacterium]